MVIYADSYSHASTINSGKIYLEINIPNEEELKRVWSSPALYHGSYGYDKEAGVVYISYDVREGLINFLNKLKDFQIAKVWKHVPFLWFLNYGEERGYDKRRDYYEQTNYVHMINRMKIQLDPRLQKVMQVYLDAYPDSKS